MLYLIEILHQTTTPPPGERTQDWLYLIEILHQTTTMPRRVLLHGRCILSKFYIKPQLTVACCATSTVVSYRNSTSNHNRPCIHEKRPRVVSYRNSTSNHNFTPRVDYSQGLYLIEILHQTTTSADSFLFCYMLYLIEILHQTTTGVNATMSGGSLYLIEILHQTTTSTGRSSRFSKLYLIEILHQTTTPLFRSLLSLRCILSKFYIKPQRIDRSLLLSLVVSYRNSTSNHNCLSRAKQNRGVVSYRNSTSNHNRSCCQSFDHRVVSYRNSTSNHNGKPSKYTDKELYLIEILHQTTTRASY